MQTIPNPANIHAPRQSIPLHKLVDQLVTGLLPNIIQLRSFIVNDINLELQVNADQNMLASVLGSLLYNTVIHSWNNCIRVSAKVFGSVMRVHVRNNSRENGKLVLDNLYQIKPLAEKLGGSISITNNMLNGTTIAFTFPNTSAAA